MQIDEALEIVLEAADAEALTQKFEEEFKKVDEIKAAINVVRLFAETADLTKIQNDLDSVYDDEENE
jgi:Skp family chaperone for outer membrane proteins